MPIRRSHLFQCNRETYFPAFKIKNIFLDINIIYNKNTRGK
jgi:hypothetical protein